MRSVGLLVVVAFSVVMAGPNLPTALLPSYRTGYGLTSFGLSLLFAGYLLVLVPSLLLATRRVFRENARVLLPLALVLALIGDLLMATAAGPVQVALGRGLSGVSAGLATGAAATLVVAAIGERGRGSVATGNIAGGLLGTALGVALAQWAVGTAVFWVHAALVLLVLPVLVFRLRSSHPRAVAGPTIVAETAGGLTPDRTALSRTALSRTAPSRTAPIRTATEHRHALLGTAAGAICWTAPALVLGLLPAVLGEITGPRGVLLATSPAVLFLACAWIFQLLVAHTGIGTLVRGQEVTIGTTVCAIGLVILGVAALWSSVPAAYLGCVLAAAGPALGYRGGMVLVTRGLTGALQGAATSRYAAISYGSSAVLAMGAGALGAAGSMALGLAVGSGVLAVAAVAVITVIVVSENHRFRAEAAERARSAAAFA